MVLELARLRAFDRPVPGVVHARRDLVGEQRRRRRRTARRSTRRRSRGRRATAGCTLRRAPGARRRGRARARGSRAGCRRGARSRPTGQHAHLAVDAAHGEDRELAVERARTLRGCSGTPPSCVHAASTSAARAQHGLALAVVAAAPRLQDRGQPERVDRGAQVGDACRRRETARCAIPSASQRLLLDEPVLRDVERARRRVAPARSLRSARAVAAGTPSHSYVTTSASLRDASAPRPRRRARRRRGRRPPRPARPSTGSRNANEQPSGMPARPSMRPSCPPPKHRDHAPWRGTLAERGSIRLRAREGDDLGSTSARLLARAATSILSSGRCSARWRVVISARVLLGHAVEPLLHLVELVAYFSHCSEKSRSSPRISFDVRSSRKLSTAWRTTASTAYSVSGEHSTILCRIASSISVAVVLLHERVHLFVRDEQQQAVDGLVGRVEVAARR